jgi:hypothetical protein
LLVQIGGKDADGQSLRSESGTLLMSCFEVLDVNAHLYSMALCLFPAEGTFDSFSGVAD